MKTVYMMIGLPGSGKSTYCKNSLHDLPVVSNDHAYDNYMREHDCTYTTAYQTLERRDVLGQFEGAFTKMLMSGNDFIIDNTNLTARGRKKVLDVIYMAGYEPKAIYFLPMDDATHDAVIAIRSGVKDIPESVYVGMTHALQPPVLTEGFSEITTIRTELVDGEFIQTVVCD